MGLYLYVLKVMVTLFLCLFDCFFFGTAGTLVRPAAARSTLWRRRVFFYKYFGNPSATIDGAAEAVVGRPDPGRNTLRYPRNGRWIAFGTVFS